MSTLGRVTVAIDVGKLANIGWWRIAGTSASGGQNLDDLSIQLASDLNEGNSVALGIEAPLFIPTPPSTAGLGRQRLGEAGRPWCAGAGTVALAFGIQQTAYVLNQVAARLTVRVRAGTDAAKLLDGSIDLLVWEAFVSSGAKDRFAVDPHIQDARAAAEEFDRRASTGRVQSDIGDAAVLNLAAAALIASGISRDCTLLTSSCAVVKPPKIA